MRQYTGNSVNILFHDRLSTEQEYTYIELVMTADALYLSTKALTTRPSDLM